MYTGDLVRLHPTLPLLAGEFVDAALTVPQVLVDDLLGVVHDTLLVEFDVVQGGRPSLSPHSQGFFHGEVVGHDGALVYSVDGRDLDVLYIPNAEVLVSQLSNAFALFPLE